MIQCLILFTNGILTINASTLVIPFFNGLMIIIIRGVEDISRIFGW